MDTRVWLLIGALALAPTTQAAAEGATPADSDLSPEEQDKRYAQRLSMGMARLNLGDLQSARTILDEAVQERPDSLQAGLFLAEAMRQQDPTRMEPVEEALRELQQRHPDAPEPLLRLALLLRDSGALDRAEALLHEGLEAFPDHPRFLHLLGTVRIARGEKDPGYRLLQKAATALPDDGLIQRDLGLALLDQGFPGQALKTLTSLKARMPLDPKLRRALSELYRGLGEEQRAAEEERVAGFFEASQDRAKRRAENRRDLSRRIDLLEKEAEAATRPGIFSELWDLYNWRGDMGWNLTRMEQLARRHPDSLDARAALGRVLLARGEGQTLIGAGSNQVSTAGEEAERILLEVIDKEPDHDLALGGLLILYGRRQDSKSLVALGERAVKERPDSAVAHVHLGRAKLVSNDRENAIAELRRALELEPANLDALLTLANVLRRSGKPNAAKPLLTRALVAGPDVPRVLMSLGQSAFQDGNDDAAWKFLIQAEDIGARHASLFISLATLHSRRGFPDAAFAYQKMARRAQRDSGNLGF